MKITDLLDDDCKIIIDKVNLPDSRRPYMVRILRGKNNVAEMLSDYDFEDFTDVTDRMYLRLKRNARRDEPSIPIQWINDKLKEWNDVEGTIIMPYSLDSIKMLLLEWKSGK